MAIADPSDLGHGKHKIQEEDEAEPEEELAAAPPPLVTRFTPQQCQIN